MRPSPEGRTRRRRLAVVFARPTTSLHCRLHADAHLLKRVIEQPIETGKGLRELRPVLSRQLHKDQGIIMATGLSIVTFDKSDIENALKNMSDSEIDELPFGAIELDASGRILRYSVVEGAITGRDPQAVIGKNFFTEVAPCTDTPRFRGEFDQGVRTGALETMFEYVFDYEMKPTKVKVHMRKGLVGDSYWVFVKRI
jgi:photoactive yellow protein